MAANLACWATGPFERFGFLAGGIHSAEGCENAPPRAITWVHGVNDALVPFAGAGDYEPVPAQAAAWATHNRCDATPADERVDADTVHRTWFDCDAPVELWVIENGTARPTSEEARQELAQLLWDDWFGT